MTEAPTEALIETVLRALEDGKGEQIMRLHVAPLTTVTDDMVLCTGSSSRHVQSLAQRVVEDAKKRGVQPRGVEGMTRAEWVLVDLGDVVVHVMQAQMRALYQLEKLWDLPPGPGARDEAASEH